MQFQQCIEWDEEKAKELAQALHDPDSKQSRELAARIDAYVAAHQPLIDTILSGNRAPARSWQ